MNFKYTTVIIMILAIFALSRGFVLNYQDITHLGAFSAHAEGDGGGGDGGGGDGGGGDGGGGDGGGGDGGGGDGGGGDDPPPPTWTNYCTGANDPNPWQIWAYDNSNPVNYRFVEMGTAANGCIPPPVWTNYCTGANDPNPWQIWAYDNSTPPNYRFIETGTVANGCAPPPPAEAPRCDSFNATPSIIFGPQNVTLAWALSGNITGVSISDIGPVTGGSRSVFVNTNTTFVLAATGPGGTVTCAATVTIIATPPATIRVNKVVINDNGGTRVISDFPLFVNATAVTNGVVNTFSPGTYTVAETNRLGYIASFSGDCDSTGNITLAAGQNKVCTITNNDVAVPPNPATIRVNKVVINDNGGTRVISDFPLFVNATAVTSGAVNTFSPGTYTVSETNQPGYAASFSGDCNASGVVTIAAGDNKVCTITNNDIAVPPNSPACTLTANPTAIQTGSSSTLSWTTTNTDTFSINQNIGSVTPVATGTRSVSPTVTTVYTGTATGPGGSVTCAATITVTATPPAPTCTLTANPTSVNSGDRSVLTWVTTNPDTFSIDRGIGQVSPAIGGSINTTALTVNTTFTGTVVSPMGQVVTCTATVTINTGGGGCTSNCGGGGGGTVSPTITLTSLPRVSSQPLAYLYLSQIPYTGLELGPIGTMLYWLALIGWALALAYLVLFGAAPLANRSFRNFGARVSAALNAREMQSAFATHSAPPVPAIKHQTFQNNTPMYPYGHNETLSDTPRGHSSYDGFKSFAHNGALSIDDIVKSLSRQQASPVAQAEPIQNSEPIYENIEMIAPIAIAETNAAPASTRGFIAALVEGDRVAVFAGLRQHVRGGGVSEQLLSEMVCLLDDAYRSRIDGTSCDADIARLTARLSTPNLEKLIASLTTAIDSSYSTGVTGAKLALTRALSILGA